MLHKYKEIVYGVLFGVGAVIMDTFIDSRMGGQDFWAALGGHRAMTLYRLLFIVYGLILGLLLWQKNSRERDFRHLAAACSRLHRECGKIAVLMHSRLQMLMTRDDLHLATGAEDLLKICCGSPTNSRVNCSPY